MAWFFKPTTNGGHNMSHCSTLKPYKWDTLNLETPKTKCSDTKEGLGRLGLGLQAHGTVFNG